MNKMAQSLASNNDRDFWAEVKKINKKHKVNTRTIDECDNEMDICNRFQTKFEKVYNSVHYDAMDMSALKTKNRSTH